MRALAPLLLAVALAPAQAAVVTFDSYPDPYQYTPTLVSEGFRFTTIGDCVGVDDQPPQALDGTPLPGAFNGTPSLLYCADPLTITAIDGQSFYLDRLDLGLSWYVPEADVGSPITVAFALAGGGSGSVVVELDRSYKTVLVGQQVLGVTLTGGRGFGYVSLDNMVVNPVPEPASAGLVVVALLGSAGAARARRRRHPEA